MCGLLHKVFLGRLGNPGAAVFVVIIFVMKFLKLFLGFRQVGVALSEPIRRLDLLQENRVDEARGNKLCHSDQQEIPRQIDPGLKAAIAVTIYELKDDQQEVADRQEAQHVCTKVHKYSRSVELLGR